MWKKLEKQIEAVPTSGAVLLVSASDWEVLLLATGRAQHKPVTPISFRPQIHPPMAKRVSCSGGTLLLLAMLGLCFNTEWLIGEVCLKMTPELTRIWSTCLVVLVNLFGWTSEIPSVESVSPCEMILNSLNIFGPI